MSPIEPRPQSRDGFPRLDATLSDLAPSFDLILCDVWGVIHNGVRRHPPAVDALRRFRRGGGTVVLVTNAPAPAAQVCARLDRLAVSREAYDAIATSGDVTVAMMVEAGCPPVYGIGPGDESALYREAGRLGPRAPRLVGVAEAAMAVCVGLDATGDRPEDYDDTLRALRARDLELICANPDLVVEVGDQLVACAGAIAERYAAIGGRVTHAGKPFPPIYALAMALARGAAEADGARAPIARDRILAIGDAMRTDVRGAANEGFASLFVTEGIHRAALHNGGRSSALEAAALRRFLSDHDATPTVAMPVLRWNR